MQRSLRAAPVHGVEGHQQFSGTVRQGREKRPIEANVRRSATALWMSISAQKRKYPRIIPPFGVVVGRFAVSVLQFHICPGL